ncbi:LolA-like outer membrane lipoprotein chaperone [Campylobacter hepaticus]|uniref:Outer membrane lipoprotein chaperone LolA n=1 Tax=Campylobacter hepaticus TaxID=1813019 RepID=A0A424Z0A6_9BACT|nr:LolA-like outer membrane lipoprotein chaperone [Campylobacter hepaticus]AXP08538.1 outer membrane lipoprotein chaperone LolA [Campylobacter hepaticus]MCZ0772377.1 LolA-like outer membrane lipoprotein chaperone [Campylobacter hepaticus]MCZ0773845.1 LolA-like outer membrane lipoprotein chaperone [Campylobacter hepaticus]MCZ0775096.1 LolA-like outer membrane lipoprotein chaperone [Campylobacter hepaticus]MDX2322965.1 LolA-like outer membrane lipoprotein chaperone [Campylobacter hepaticus]
MQKIFLIFLIFMGKILALELDFKAFSSDFVQTVTSKNSKLSYSGHFIFDQNRAYWVYHSPSKKEIYIHNNEVTIIEHDLEQVIFSHLDNIPNLNEIFKKAKVINKDKLIAKYENIDYTIKLHQDQIQSISYQDEFENNVVIVLSHQLKNPRIKAEIFQAHIPKNYDIIR